jgi:hypothetical protein
LEFEKGRMIILKGWDGSEREKESLLLFGK